MLSKIEFSDQVKVSLGNLLMQRVFVFDPHITYQSYKLTAELHLTRKETFF